MAIGFQLSAVGKKGYPVWPTADSRRPTAFKTSHAWPARLACHHSTNVTWFGMQVYLTANRQRGTRILRRLGVAVYRLACPEDFDRITRMTRIDRIEGRTAGIFNPVDPCYPAILSKKVDRLRSVLAPLSSSWTRAESWRQLNADC